MAEEEDKKDDAAEETGAKQPMFSKVGLIVFMVWTILLAGGMAFFLKPTAPSTGEDGNVKATIKKVKVTGTVIEIGSVPITVIVNATTQEAKLINVELSVELDPKSDEKAVEMLEALKPWIKSELIGTVQSRGFSELMKPEARNYVKNKMKEIIDNRFRRAGHTEVKIKDVLITSFIIAG